MGMLSKTINFFGSLELRLVKASRVNFFFRPEVNIHVQSYIFRTFIGAALYVFLSYVIIDVIGRNSNTTCGEKPAKL